MTIPERISIQSFKITSFDASHSHSLSRASLPNPMFYKQLLLSRI